MDILRIFIFVIILIAGAGFMISFSLGICFYFYVYICDIINSINLIIASESFIINTGLILFNTIKIGFMWFMDYGFFMLYFDLIQLFLD